MVSYHVGRRCRCDPRRGIGMGHRVRCAGCGAKAGAMATGHQLADFLYWLPWAADTTLRRPADATWPIIDRVRYTAALARRFAADPMGELSGAVRAVANGRWPPENHGAWLTRCHRLAQGDHHRPGRFGRLEEMAEPPARPRKPTECANRRPRPPQYPRRQARPTKSSYETPIGANTSRHRPNTGETPATGAGLQPRGNRSGLAHRRGTGDGAATHRKNGGRTASGRTARTQPDNAPGDHMGTGAKQPASVTPERSGAPPRLRRS